MASCTVAASRTFETVKTQSYRELLATCNVDSLSQKLVQQKCVEQLDRFHISEGSRGKSETQSKWNYARWRHYKTLAADKEQIEYDPVTDGGSYSQETSHSGPLRRSKLNYLPKHNQKKDEDDETKLPELLADFHFKGNAPYTTPLPRLRESSKNTWLRGQSQSTAEVQACGMAQRGRSSSSKGRGPRCVLSPRVRVRTSPTRFPRPLSAQITSKRRIPLPCLSEERGEREQEDLAETNLNELASYLENSLFLPKKMSPMAEMMYT